MGAYAGNDQVQEAAQTDSEEAKEDAQPEEGLNPRENEERQIYTARDNPIGEL